VGGRLRQQGRGGLLHYDAAPTGLAALLGPGLRSRLCDTYYGFTRTSSPCERVSQRLNVNTNQFGLNMIELVADKSVGTTPPPRHHVALRFFRASDEYGELLSVPTELGFDQYLIKEGSWYMAPIGKGLQINVGIRYAGGCRVIESKEIGIIRESCLFPPGPFRTFHFGANANYAFNAICGQPDTW